MATTDEGHISGEGVRVIYKYPVVITGWQRVPMARGAEILSIQVQNDAMWLWALVDTAEPTEAREVHMVGTGHTFPSQSFPPYLATVQFGPYVWHFFAHRKLPQKPPEKASVSLSGGSADVPT